MVDKRLSIVERDDVGNVLATYIQSSSGKDQKVRIDSILPAMTKSPWQRLLDVFLPAGYPHSVTSDYLEYQIYDSLQAFSSSIASLLSSRAVLSSVGVGDSTASPTAALLLNIFQESAGRIATILFAHRFGTALEPECKMYRLLADVLNDFAFVLDCLSPAFPKPVRVVVLSTSSVLRALCGVAAGSAKASLSAHFARWGNLGELNAKDASQETVISLLGMLAGSLVVTWINTATATWTTLILLLAVHLETNRRAVRAVTMRTLNRQRAGLVWHHLHKGHVPAPEEVAMEERIFERDGALRDARGEVIGRCTVGSPVERVLRALAPPHRIGSGTEPDHFARVMELYKDSAYIMYFNSVVSTKDLALDVVLKQGATPLDQVTAWWQALAAAIEQARLRNHEQTDAQGKRPEEEDGGDMQVLGQSLSAAEGMMKKYAGGLREKGWDLDTGALETTSSTRVTIEESP